MEIWEEVYGFDSLYEISNLGRLRTKHHGARGYQKEYRYIEPRDNGKGYLCFNLKSNHTQKTVYVHRLVANAFVANPNKHTEINHKDENKRNNSADNLEWCSHINNCNYGTRNERAKAKRTRKIICNETGVIYNSVEQAAEIMGVGKTAISNCLHGRTKTCAGYTWRLVNV